MTVCGNELAIHINKNGLKPDNKGFRYYLFYRLLTQNFQLSLIIADGSINLDDMFN
jgi:hypothetical protein